MQHESDEFKSYGEKSEDGIDLMQNDPLKRSTRAVEERLFAIYQKNLERKKQLQQRINRIELVCRQKMTAKQLLLDRHRAHSMFVDLDEEFEPPAEFFTLRNDFQRRKKEMEALEASYTECQKVSARMFVELQLSQNKTLREILRNTTEVAQYLFLEKLKLIAVLLTRKGKQFTTLLFRSTGVPTVRHISIQLDTFGTRLFSNNNSYLIATTVDSKFHIYDLDKRAMLVSSSTHESEVVYVQLYRSEADPNWAAVSVTKEGVVRVFDLHKKVLKSLLICEEGSCYYLREETLLYGAGTKLRSVNIITKEYKEIISIADPIVSINEKTISTKNYHLNNYINSKGEIKVPEPSSFRLIEINGQPAHLSSTEKENRFNHKSKEYAVDICYDFIGSFAQGIPNGEEGDTQQIVLWGDKRGQLYELIIE